MEGCQPLFLLKVGEINAHICSRGDNVELRVKDINPMNNTIETRKGESSVTLILTYGIFAENMEVKQC